MPSNVATVEAVETVGASLAGTHQSVSFDKWCTYLSSESLLAIADHVRQGKGRMRSLKQAFEVFADSHTRFVGVVGEVLTFALNDRLGLEPRFSAQGVDITLSSGRSIEVKTSIENRNGWYTVSIKRDQLANADEFHLWALDRSCRQATLHVVDGADYRAAVAEFCPKQNGPGPVVTRWHANSTRGMAGFLASTRVEYLASYAHRS